MARITHQVQYLADRHIPDDFIINSEVVMYQAVAHARRCLLLESILLQKSSRLHNE